MDEYEKLKELYEHMMAVRKESRQHIQEEGLWFPERQQQAVRDDLQALSQAQDALCQALAQVQIATIRGTNRSLASGTGKPRGHESHGTSIGRHIRRGLCGN